MFYKDMEFKEVPRVIIEAKEVTEVPAMIGLEAPEALFLNSQDFGFGVFLIDDKSMKLFEQNLGKIPD